MFIQEKCERVDAKQIGSLLQEVPNDESFMRIAAAGKIRSVVNAALAGLPLPLCSCGVVPAAMSIRKRGASRGATLSFLISTPDTGVDSIAITYALLDPLMAIFRPLATIVTAVLTGLASNFLIEDEPEKQDSKKRENCGTKAGVLAVSTLFETPVQENSCSHPSISPSCSCSRPANLAGGKIESSTIKVNTLEVKPK